MTLVGGDKTSQIKIFAMDVDGVLTDGCMYYSTEGEVMKKFNTRDGMGIELLRQNGITPVIVTQEDSEIVKKRAAKLKVTEVYTGIRDKLDLIRKVASKYGVGFGEIAYIGDDINDLEVLKQVGLSFAPGDAVEVVQEAVSRVVSRRGGEGAVREAIDLVLGGIKA